MTETEMTPAKRTVLLVEENPLIMAALEMDLEAAGFSVVLARRPEDARREIAFASWPDALVVDVEWPEASGLRLAEEFAAQNPGAAIVVMTVSDRVARMCLPDGASLHLKHLARYEISRSVREALANASCRHPETLDQTGPASCLPGPR